MADITEVFGPVIDSYTRAQAIDDGWLLDVSDTAKEAGFKWPVAITNSVWEGYIKPDPRSRSHGQSETGRLWDVLFVLFCVIKARRDQSGDQLMYKVRFIMKERQVRDIVLKAMFGPGDNGEPVVTIMLPEED